MPTKMLSRPTWSDNMYDTKVSCTMTPRALHTLNTRVRVITIACSILSCNCCVGSNSKIIGYVIRYYGYDPNY